MTPTLSTPDPSSVKAALDVRLLPDARFFVRSLPLAADTPPEEVASQVELALEAVSPFPLAQLYYGYFWRPGSPRVLVYAAYRKRFPPEETESWGGADLVMPSLVALLDGEPVAAATTWVLPAEDTVTVLHWAEAGPVPTHVLTRPWPPETEEAARDRVRDALLRELAGSQTILDLPAPPAYVPSEDEQAVVLVAGHRRTTVARTHWAALDVRDKADLVALRRARARDLLLWRGLLVGLGLIVFAGLAELALVGGRYWQKQRQALWAGQRPTVEKIMTTRTMTVRLDELSTKRLLPLEMIDIVQGPLLPSIHFLSTTTNGLRGLEIEALTTEAADVNAYQMALNALPAVERAELVEHRTRNNQTHFTLLVIFKPDAVKPGLAPSSP